MQRNKHHRQAARAPDEGKESMPRKEMKFSAITYSLPKRRRDDDKSLADDLADDLGELSNFHLLIRELKNGCHYCR